LPKLVVIFYKFSQISICHPVYKLNEHGDSLIKRATVAEMNSLSHHAISFRYKRTLFASDVK